MHQIAGRHSAEGEIIEILGHKDDPGVDILSIIRKHGLPEKFPEEVLAKEQIPGKSAKKKSRGRRDLRELPWSPLTGKMRRIWMTLFRWNIWKTAISVWAFILPT